MSTVPSTSTFRPDFASIFDAALESYRRKTKKDLASHPLFIALQSCDSPEATLSVFRKHIPAFNTFKNIDDRFTKWVIPTVNVLHVFSGTLDQVVGLVIFKPFCHEGISVLIYFPVIPTSKRDLYGDWRSPLGQCPYLWYLGQAILTVKAPQAAKDASACQDKLIDIFIRIERFFQRLDKYTSITPTMAMMEMVIEIMVEVINILAIATNVVKSGRLSESVSLMFTIPV